MTLQRHPAPHPSLYWII